MTDEEKKAIEFFKKRQDFMKSEPKCITTLEESIDILLNLIEKQQKEIEELKDIQQKICNEELFEKDYIISNYVSKAKIKAKIEELIKEGNYRTADNPNGRVHFQKEVTDYQIAVLQSLLEKE